MRKSGNTIRVLVVDDSPLVRDLIAHILGSDPGIEIIGTAANGMEAVSRAALLKPDLITMDIEMPVMDGLGAIERIMRESPAPILVVTAVGGVRTAFAAVSKGALDVVEKPDISLAAGHALIKKVRILAGVNVAAHLAARNGAGTAGQPKPVAVGGRGPKERIVAIASSTGGPQALHSILSRLPAGFPAPIVIAQHIADGFTQGMVEWLGGICRLKIRQAENGDCIAPGVVHVNPAEFSMKVTGHGTLMMAERTVEEKYRPPCDALLRSVAESGRDRAVGVILSGMGDDGVEGIGAIKAAGGVTMAQDDRSSVVYGMNRLAVERGYVGQVLTPEEIAGELARLVGIKVEG